MNLPSPSDDTPSYSLRAGLYRIGGMVLRHLYLLRSSWPRLFELAYWPTLQVLIWGFLSEFLRGNSSYVASAFGVLLAAVLLWDVLVRSQMGYFTSFLEEMWARHMPYLYVTPMRPAEHVLSLIAMSFLRMLISVTPAVLISLFLYKFSIFTLGLPLIVFFVNLLIMGWSLGILVTGLLFRFGMAAESFSWGLAFIFAPLSAVYYPLSTLPEWLQPISAAIPATHVFEGMRSVIFEGTLEAELLIKAFSLNLIYLAVTSGLYLYFFHQTRKRGLMMQSGE